MSSAIFLLVKTGRISLFIFFPRSDSCLRTMSADLWSLNGRIIRTGAFLWTSRTCCWFRDSMNLVMVELMSFSGYLSFKKIPLKLSHSSANISGEDERQWARFCWRMWQLERNLLEKTPKLQSQLEPCSWNLVNDHLQATTTTLWGYGFTMFDGVFLNLMQPINLLCMISSYLYVRGIMYYAPKSMQNTFTSDNTHHNLETAWNKFFARK